MKHRRGGQEVLVRFRSLLTGAAAIAVLSLNLWAQAETGPQWKDRAEYDLVASIGKTTDPKKKIELLNQWKEKYPATDFKQLRFFHYLEAYQQSNQIKEAIALSEEYLKSDPKEFRALNYIAYYTPLLNDTSEAALSRGEMAAKGLLANLDATFEASKKPANVDDATWKKARTEAEALAHKTLGWVSMIRKNNEVAETELRKSLELNQGQGDVYYWLANVVAAQRKPDRQSEVLFRYARAAVYDGPGALPPAGRQEVDKYLQRAYTGYHGDATGLDQLKQQAKGSIDPPAGFKIESIKEKMEKDIAKQEEFKKQNPELALWMGVKTELTGPNGAQYFESSMKGAGLPPLKGKVVSHTPATRPKEVVIAISDGITPEVTLKLDNPLPGKADPGTELTFEGAVPQSYTVDPFNVVMEIESSKIKGWPAPAPAKPAGRKPARKRR